MTQYLVTWAIDIEADSPQEAAEKARACQTRPDTTATVFDVAECLYEDHPERGGYRVATIDLSYPEETILYSVDTRWVKWSVSDLSNDRTGP